MRYSAFVFPTTVFPAFFLGCLWMICTSPVLAQEPLLNPVVADAMPGEFQHGAYPSIGNRTHPGSDLAAACGSTVRAFADGEVVDVISSADDPDFNTLGYMVILKHPESLLGDPFFTGYFHLNKAPFVNRGVEVYGGKSRLGEVGNSGIAYTCHLHFEMRTFPERFNPTWQNMLGEGDQREKESFLNHWENPLDYFLIYPKGLVYLADGAVDMETAVDRVPEDKEPVFTIVEEMPQMVGGIKALQKEVNYPDEAKERKIQGRVFVQFVVNKDGEPENFQVVRGLGYGCDEAAVEAIREMEFRPGRNRGEVVNVKMSLPVVFSLN